MKVIIKNFDVNMEIKNKGIELDVIDSSGHKGDLVITKTKLEWCAGKINPGKGKSITWEQFIQLINDNS